MAAYTKFYPFAEALAEKKHNLGTDQLKIFLTNVAPSQSNGVLADITEIAYTNLSSRNLTTLSSAQTAGVYKLVLQDLILTASGGAVAAFRYVGIYNEDAANDELIGYVDYGASITLADGETFTLDFDGSNGVIQLS